MYRIGLLLTSFVIALWSFPAVAQQQPPCVDRADFLEHLSANYEEAPVAMGLTTGGGLLEVIVSRTGSWTIIVTTPNGVSCGVASGEGWESTFDTLYHDPKA
jgi:hypothetical protein